MRRGPANLEELDECERVFDLLDAQPDAPCNLFNQLLWLISEAKLYKGITWGILKYQTLFKNYNMLFCMTNY